MDQDNIGSGQFMAASDIIDDVVAMMDDELEIKAADVPAGAAGASRVLAHHGDAITESKIQRLDGIEDLARRLHSFIVREG